MPKVFVSYGEGLAVAGAISGRRMGVLVPAIVGAVLGWILVMLVWNDRERAASAAVFGVPAGALLGGSSASSRERFARGQRLRSVRKRHRPKRFCRREPSLRLCQES
jgi:hypothetical protein